jgi:hypothetical protein
LKDKKRKYEKRRKKEERSSQVWSNGDVKMKKQVAVTNQDGER